MSIQKISYYNSFNSSHSLTSSASIVNNVPVDILRKIGSFLDIPDLIHFGLANRHLSQLFSDRPLWDFFLEKDFPDSYANLEANVKNPAALYKELAIVAHNMKIGKYRLQTLSGHQDLVSCVIVCKDELISGSWDQTIKIWDLKTGQELQTLDGHGSLVHCITVCHDKLISGSEDGTIKIWDFKTGKELQTLRGHQDAITCLTIYKDKFISCSGGGTIKVWDLETGLESQTLNGDQSWVDCATVCGDKLIFGSQNTTIKIWDLKTGELKTLNGHQRGVTCIIAYDGKIISGSTDKTIKIWDLETGRELQTLNGHRSEITCITVCEGKLISASEDRAIKIWDLKTGRELQTLHQDSVDRIIVRDGKLIFSSICGYTIQILDYNFPSLSPYSKQLLEDNLALLRKIASASDQPEIFKELSQKLHPDFQQRLQQHSFKVWVSAREILPSSKILASFPCCEAISQMQIEVCLEALLDASHDEDYGRVDLLCEQLMENPVFKQLFENDPEILTIYNLLRKPLHNVGRLASLLQKEEEVITLKQILKKRWGEDLSLLLLDLGIVTKEEYSKQLRCTPDHLPKIGLSFPADLQALFNSPDFQHLKLTAEEVIGDDLREHEARAFDKQRIISTHLDQLLAAAQQKSDETRQCFLRCVENGIVYDPLNPWIAFQEKLSNFQAELNMRNHTRQDLLKKFSPEIYVVLVGKVNDLIDEFRTLEPATQILRLHAYVNQWGILGKWNSLRRNQDIKSLAALMQKESAPQGIFNIGK